MGKIKSKDVTEEIVHEVNAYLGYDDSEKVLSDYGYAFYYNQIQNDLDACDADRYANLNTILGYDVGIRKFRILDEYLWTHGFDLIELCGSDEDMEWLQEATKNTKTKELDFSKWRGTVKSGTFTYYAYFENGKRYEQ